MVAPSTMKQKYENYKLNEIETARITLASTVILTKF